MSSEEGVPEIEKPEAVGDKFTSGRIVRVWVTVTEQDNADLEEICKLFNENRKKGDKLVTRNVLLYEFVQDLIKSWKGQKENGISGQDNDTG